MAPWDVRFDPPTHRIQSKAEEKFLHKFVTECTKQIVSLTQLLGVTLHTNIVQELESAYAPSDEHTVASVRDFDDEEEEEVEDIGDSSPSEGGGSADRSRKPAALSEDKNGSPRKGDEEEGGSSVTKNGEAPAPEASDKKGAEGSGEKADDKKPEEEEEDSEEDEEEESDDMMSSGDERSELSLFDIPDDGSVLSRLLEEFKAAPPTKKSAKGSKKGSPKEGAKKGPSKGSNKEPLFVEGEVGAAAEVAPPEGASSPEGVPPREGGKEERRPLPRPICEGVQRVPRQRPKLLPGRLPAEHRYE